MCVCVLIGNGKGMCTGRIQIYFLSSVIGDLIKPEDVDHQTIVGSRAWFVLKNLQLLQN